MFKFDGKFFPHRIKPSLKRTRSRWPPGCAHVCSRTRTHAQGALQYFIFVPDSSRLSSLDSFSSSTQSFNQQSRCFRVENIFLNILIAAYYCCPFPRSHRQEPGPSYFHSSLANSKKEKIFPQKPQLPAGVRGPSTSACSLHPSCHPSTASLPQNHPLALPALRPGAPAAATSPACCFYPLCPCLTLVLSLLQSNPSSVSPICRF